MRNKRALFGILIIAGVLIILIFAGVLYFLIKNTGLTITKGDIVVELGGDEDKNGDMKNNGENVVPNITLMDNNVSEEDKNLTNQSQ